MEGVWDNLQEYMTYVSKHWSKVVNSNQSLSIPQVQNILLKNWKKGKTQNNKSKKEKAQKTVPFFQENFKNPYFSSCDKDTATVSLSDKVNVDGDHIKVTEFDSNKVAPMEYVQETSVESETVPEDDDIQEEEDEKSRLSQEDILHLTRPSMRKSVARKEDKKIKCKTAKKRNDSVQSIAADKTQHAKKEEPDLLEKEGGNISFQTPKPKSWKPPFNPVCWKLGCKFCDAKKCGVCVNCVKKERCVWRECPRMSNKDIVPPEKTNRDIVPPVKTNKDIVPLEKTNRDIVPPEKINSLPTKNVIIEGSSNEKPEAGNDEVSGNNNNSKKQDEDVSKFKCGKCGKSFKYLKSLNNHKCGEKSKSCPSCSKIISNANFAKHIKLHSVPKFKCAMCNRLFHSEAKKDSHMKIHSEYTCTYCGKKFENPVKLKRHLPSHGEKQQSGQVKTVNCKVCKAEVLWESICKKLTKNWLLVVMFVIQLSLLKKL